MSTFLFGIMMNYCISTNKDTILLNECVIHMTDCISETKKERLLPEAEIFNICLKKDK